MSTEGGSQPSEPDCGGKENPTLYEQAAGEIIHEVNRESEADSQPTAAEPAKAS